MMAHPSRADAQAVEAQHARLESAVDFDEDRIRRDEVLDALDRLEKAHDRCVALAQAHGRKLTAPYVEWYVAHEQLVAAKAAWWIEIQNFRTISDVVKCPEPGVYPGVPHDEYLRWDAASNSRLGKLVPPSTPAHLKAYLEEPQPDKKVWKEGRALHACILEPERYEREYRLGGNCLGTTKKGEPCGAPPTIPVHGGAVCRYHTDGFKLDDAAVLISAADDQMVRRCRERFKAHAMAGGFLTVPDAQYELSIVWDQPVGEGRSVRCKARLDWYSETFMGGLPMDLKGIREAHEREVKKQAFQNGYLRQSVLYRLGLRALGLPARTFAVVAQEKTAPYELAVYMLGDMATGHLPDPGEEPFHVSANVLAALRLYDWCRETGEYPGYPEVVTDLSNDEWVWSALDTQTSQINDFLQERAA